MSGLELPNQKGSGKGKEQRAPLILDADNDTPESAGDISSMNDMTDVSLQPFEDSKENSNGHDSIGTQSGRLSAASDTRSASLANNGESGPDNDSGASPKSPNSKKKKDDEPSLMEVAKSMSKEAKKVSFQRLLRQSKRERKLLSLGIGFTLCNSLITLCTPIIMGAIISSISKDDITKADLSPPVTYVCDLSPIGCNGNRNLLQTAIYTLFLLAAFGAFFSFMKWTCLEVAGERVVARIRKVLFHRILCQEIGLFDITKTGELVNRLSTDTTVLKYACTTQVAQSLSSLTGIILSVFYVFYLSWRLTCVMLGIVPIVVVVAKFYGHYYRKQSKLNQDFLAEATQVATESIGLIRTVKSFSKEDFEEQKYNGAIDSTYKQGVKMALANGGFMAFFTIISNVGIGSVLWYGATLTFHGTLNAGSLTTYVILTIQIGFQFSSLINLYTNVMKALGASERVFALIDRDPKVKAAKGSNENDVTNPFAMSSKEEKALQKLNLRNSGRDGYVQDKEIGGNVEIQNVTFGYPSRPGVKVLENLNLQVSPGKITALVGESGGGKSTVAKLVMRFYDPNEGLITIDGRPLQDYDLRWLHQQIGFVSQEPVLFGATIKENIVYGVRQNYYHVLAHINEFNAFGKNKNKDGLKNGSNFKNRLKNKKNDNDLTKQLQYSQLQQNNSGNNGNGKNQQAVNSVSTLDMNNVIEIGSGNDMDTLVGREITDDDIINAAKQANAHNFIMSFPDGYDTLVGERGIRLSGGQKQRVAIARAILMNPKILLLDEATSALDSESEYLVQQALDRIMVGRSVLVIAHRLSTVKSADRVCVIEKGRVVEMGRHEELIGKENGSYSKLVKRQLFAH